MIVGVDERNKVLLTTTPFVGAKAGDYRVITLKQVPRILVDRTVERRPLVGGISVGHIEITAGSLACIVMRDNDLYLLSNGHVFHPKPWESGPPMLHLEITQPGPHDVSKNYPHDDLMKYVCATYKDHVPVNVERGSACPVARAWSGIYNSLASLCGAKTRLRPWVAAEANKVDCAIATPNVDFKDRILDDDGSEIDPNGIVGLLFAGSDMDKIYIACKASNIQQLLNVRFLHGIHEPQINEVVHKCGRTTGHTSGPVLSTSMKLQVWYGVGYATFEDCIVVNAACGGGDSGSLVFV
jgi:hypothetical protein